jgi:hypothetical protein
MPALVILAIPAIAPSLAQPAPEPFTEEELMLAKLGRERFALARASGKSVIDAFMQACPGVPKKIAAKTAHALMQQPEMLSLFAQAKAFLATRTSAADSRFTRKFGG